MADERSGDLLARWRAGDQLAAADLFERYASRLVALARSRLSARFAGRVDPEDIVQSVYRSFFADARAGRYDLQRGGDLWRLLVAITLHKLYGQVKLNTRGKRHVDREQTFGSEDSLVGLQAHLATHAPSPEEAAALADELDQIMRRLDPDERRMLELRLQGYNLEEIAAELHCSERTVRYALSEVKGVLEQRRSQGAGA